MVVSASVDVDFHIQSNKKIKQMKKVMIFAVLIAGVYLASCTQNDVSPTNTATLATSAARTANADSSGKGHSHKDTIAIAALPAAITSYVKATYPAATIHRASQSTTDGTFRIMIIDAAGIRKGLKFDVAGVFVSESIKTNKHTDSTHVHKDSTNTGSGKGKKNKGGKR
jgi:hypothetical protein